MALLSVLVTAKSLSSVDTPITNVSPPSGFVVLVCHKGPPPFPFINTLKVIVVTPLPENKTEQPPELAAVALLLICEPETDKEAFPDNFERVTGTLLDITSNSAENPKVPKLPPNPAKCKMGLLTALLNVKVRSAILYLPVVDKPAAAKGVVKTVVETA